MIIVLNLLQQMSHEEDGSVLVATLEQPVQARLVQITLTLPEPTPQGNSKDTAEVLCSDNAASSSCAYFVHTDAGFEECHAKSLSAEPLVSVLEESDVSGDPVLRCRTLRLYGTVAVAPPVTMNSSEKNNSQYDQVMQLRPPTTRQTKRASVLDLYSGRVKQLSLSKDTIRGFAMCIRHGLGPQVRELDVKIFSQDLSSSTLQRKKAFAGRFQIPRVKDGEKIFFDLVQLQNVELCEFEAVSCYAGAGECNLGEISLYC